MKFRTQIKSQLLLTWNVLYEWCSKSTANSVTPTNSVSINCFSCLTVSTYINGVSSSRLGLTGVFGFRSDDGTSNLLSSVSYGCRYPSILPSASYSGKTANGFMEFGLYLILGSNGVLLLLSTGVLKHTCGRCMFLAARSLQRWKEIRF